MADINYVEKVKTASGYDKRYPKTTALQVITDANNRFVSDSEKNSWNSLAAGGASGGSAKIFDGLMEEADRNVTIVRSGTTITETIKVKSTAKILAKRTTTRSADNNTMTTIIDFYKADGVTIESKVTVTAVRDASKNITINTV